jgi:hypothetical protein
VVEKWYHCHSCCCCSAGAVALPDRTGCDSMQHDAAVVTSSLEEQRRITSSGLSVRRPSSTTGLTVIISSLLDHTLENAMTDCRPGIQPVCHLRNSIVTGYTSSCVSANRGKRPRLLSSSFSLSLSPHSRERARLFDCQYSHSLSLSLPLTQPQHTAWL